MKKTDNGYNIIPWNEYIIFLPPQFERITKKHVDALNKDIKKSFIIRKKVCGVLYIKYKGKKPDNNKETKESDTDTVDSKEKKVSKKAN